MAPRAVLAVATAVLLAGCGSTESAPDRTALDVPTAALDVPVPGAPGLPNLPAPAPANPGATAAGASKGVPKAPKSSPEVIAFSDRDASGDEEIFTIRPDGTGRRQLTRDTGLDSEPAVSPDGTRIAWASDAERNNVDIFIMNVDGTAKKRLTKHLQPDSDPTFSPDGKTIAFRSDRRATAAEIWTMNVDGTGLRRLTDAGRAGLQSYQPSFGPGGRIVFTSDRDATKPVGSRNEIWTMNCNGSAQRRLTDNAFNDSLPSWSPRGNRIAFWSNEADGNIDVWSVDPDGTRRERLTRDEGNDTDPTFSPDGSRIAFTSTRDGDAKRSGDDAIWLMNADGSAPRRLTSGTLASWGGGFVARTDLSCQDDKGSARAPNGPESGADVPRATARKPF